MRNPFRPIPSPGSATQRSLRFWEGPETIPPPLPGTPPPEPMLDRRRRGLRLVMATSPRALREAPPVAVTCRHGRALMRIASLCSAGVVLRLVDLLDPTLPPRERDAGRRAFASRSGAGAAHGGNTSLLGFVSGCVLAKRVVADLASWANPSRSPAAGRRDVAVTLLLAGGPPTLEIPGMLAPLTDPGPDIIGVSLTPEALAPLCKRLGLTRVPALVRPTSAVPRPELRTAGYAPAPRTMRGPPGTAATR